MSSYIAQPCPTNNAISTNDVVNPVLNTAVHVLIALIFGYMSLSLLCSIAWTMVDKKVESRGWQLAKYGFATVVGLGLSVAIPLISMIGYGDLMADAPAQSPGSPGLIYPWDFANFFVMCLSMAFLLILYIVYFGKRFVWYNYEEDEEGKKKRTTVKFSQHQFIRLAQYCAAYCTIYQAVIVEGFTAASWDFRNQFQTIPSSVAGAALGCAIILFITGFVSIMMYSDETTKKTDFDKILEAGKSECEVSDVYSFDVNIVNYLKSMMVVPGIDIGYPQIVARVASLAFFYLCKYGDMVKFLTQFFSIPIPALMISAIFGSQFYLPFEGVLNLFVLSDNYFAVTYIANCTMGSATDYENALRYNSMLLFPSESPLRIELYSSCPALFVITAVVANTAALVALALTYLKYQVKQERVFSVHLLKAAT